MILPGHYSKKKKMSLEKAYKKMSNKIVLSAEE